MKLYKYFENIKETKKLLSNAKSIKKLKEILSSNEETKDIKVSSKVGVSLSEDRKNIISKHPDVSAVTSFGIGGNITDTSVPKSFRSGSSQVFKVELKNEDFFFFKITGSGDIGEKELVPSNLLDLSTNKRYSKNELVNLVKEKISGKGHFNPKIKELINHLLTQVEKMKQLMPAEGNAKKIFLEEKNFLQKIKEFNKDDMNKIWKDLGEIFSAIIACEGRSNAKIYFPHNVKNELIDFFIELGPNDVESYSSKAIKKASDGAGKPSLTSLISFMDEYKLVLKNNPKENILYEIMKKMNSTKGMADSYITLLDFLETHHPGVKQKTLDLFKSDFKRSYDKTNVDDKRLFASRAYLTCKKLLNEEYADTLTQIINAKVKVNQAYLVSEKQDGLLFYFKNFKDLKFEFEAGVDSKNIKTKMGFSAVISENDLK